MSKPKMIIIEGTRGVGKTTVTDWIREKLAYTNLYRLAGNADKSVEGYKKSYKMYSKLLDYINTLGGCDINLVFDRIFFSEWVYCRCGFKDYDFEEAGNEFTGILNNEISKEFDIYLIHLWAPADTLDERLNKRDSKGNYYGLPYNVENSMQQHLTYGLLIDDLKETAKNIKILDIDTSQDWTCILEKEILGID